MAIQGGTYLTYADLATRTDAKGMGHTIAEVIDQDNGLPADMPMKPSSEATGHKAVIRTGLPEIHTRRINQGVLPSKSSTSVIRETMTMLEARSHVDEALLRFAQNPGQIRMDEGRPFIEGFIQKVTDLVIRGDPSTSGGADFLGLQGRYNALTGSNISDNVIGCGGTGSDLSSIYVVRWGDGIHGIFPMNSHGGLRKVDRGLQSVADTSGSEATNHGSRMLEAYVDKWYWDIGLVVSDWRNCVRVCNIESSDALGLSGTQELTDYGTNIRYAMSDAIERIPTVGSGRMCIYMPRSLKIALKKMNKALTSANIFETEKVDGRPVTVFEGVEVKVLDQLRYNETAVS